MPKLQTELEKTIEINEQKIIIRPITKDDMQREKDFVAKLSSEKRCVRFLDGILEISDKAVQQLLDIDFVDKMIFIAVIESNSDNKTQEIGLSRYITDQEGACECSVTVDDDWQNKGIGRELIDMLIKYIRGKNKKIIYSYDMRSNIHMQDLAEDIGMKKIVHYYDPSLVWYELALDPKAITT